MIQRMIAAGLCGVFGLVLAPACDGLGLGGEGGVGGGSGEGGGGAVALMQDDLDDPEPAGGLKCSGPDDCLNKCNVEAKYCGAAKSYHPYKAGLIGELYQCIDRFPKAKHGGSYTCLYRYPNDDACVFAYGSKLGPLKIPAPPPLCVYKSN